MGSLPSKKEKTPLQIDPSTKRLDLRNKGIKNLKKVPELPELVWLNLPNNEIRLLPKHAGSLYPILQTLKLMSNQLSEIPASFATMRHLVSIDLGKNRFTNFPLVLCEILSLTDLSLQFNKIETVPIELSRLTNLRVLNLSTNKLCEIGPIWGPLKSLETIDISHNKLKTLDGSFSSLANLVTLNISGNEFTEMPTYFGSLTNLKTLDLRLNKALELTSENIQLPPNLKVIRFRNNKVRSLAHFSQVESIEEIQGDSNQIVEFPNQLNLLKNLKILILYLNNIEKLPDAIGELVSLTELDISMNRVATIPNSISQLTRLKTLAAQNNVIEHIEDDAFKGLYALNTLLLSSNKIARLPNSFSTLSNLYRLELSRNKILEDNFPTMDGLSINYLDLGCNQFTTIPKTIFTLQNMSVLNVFDNQLREIQPEISQLKMLKRLNLSYNVIKDLPNKISELMELAEINLDGCNLSSIPVSIFELPKLRTLTLNNNFLTTLPEEFAKLSLLSSFSCSINQLENINISASNKDLVELNVSHNRIETLPKNFTDLINLKYLDISGNYLTRFIDLKKLTHIQIMFNNMPDRIQLTGKSYVIDTGRNSKKTLATTSMERSEDSPVKSLKSSDKLSPLKKSGDKIVVPLKPYYHSFGWAETRGRRPEMQDTIVIDDTILHRDITAIGIFDGHSGSLSAELVAMSLKHTLHKQFDRDQMNDPDFLNEKLYKTFESLHGAIASKSLEDGTTALLALIINTNGLPLSDNTDTNRAPILAIAHCGDQGAVLCSDGKGLKLTEDHKPDSEQELSRIKEAGGFVSEYKRVNGVLAVSRALGDLELNPYITFNPQIIIAKITNCMEFLILACDGLWDVLSFDQAVDMIRHENNPIVAASILKDFAYSLNSGDNITVAVYRFKLYTQGVSMIEQ